MPLPRLAPVLLAVVLLSAGCTSGADEPQTFRPPPAGSLDDGPCALVADDVVELGRIAFDLRDQAAPDQAVADELDAAQDRVAAVAESADPALKPALDRLVLTTGLLRIQVATGMLREEVRENMDQAYDGAVRACSGEPAASPSAG